MLKKGLPLLLALLVSCGSVSATAESKDYWDAYDDAYNTPSELTVSNRFEFDSKVYVELSDRSYWVVPPVMTEPGGFFSSAKYEDPTRYWMPGDEVQVRRATSGDCPVILVNLQVQKDAPAKQVNWELLLQESQDQRYNALRQEIDVLKYRLEDNAWWDEQTDRLLKDCYDDIRRLEGRISRVEKEVDRLSQPRDNKKQIDNAKPDSEEENLESLVLRQDLRRRR